MLAAATELQTKQCQTSGTEQLPAVHPKARQCKRASDVDDVTQQTPSPKRSPHQTDTPDAVVKAKPTKRARRSRAGRALARIGNPAFDSRLHEIRELAAELQKLKESAWIVDDDADALKVLLEQIGHFQQFPLPRHVLQHFMIRKLYRPVCGSLGIRIGEDVGCQDATFVSNIALSMWQVSVYLAEILQKGSPLIVAQAFGFFGLAYAAWIPWL